MTASGESASISERLRSIRCQIGMGTETITTRIAKACKDGRRLVRSRLRKQPRPNPRKQAISARFWTKANSRTSVPIHRINMTSVNRAAALTKKRREAENPELVFVGVATSERGVVVCIDEGPRRKVLRVKMARVVGDCKWIICGVRRRRRAHRGVVRRKRRAG